ncbi:MAG: glycine cleavage system aminomethyltransferase GcvT [Candidatus Desulforudis sp.]|nr:glycine cleavage system aminomethyltransferase GcvT [Desulforudis sp.]
MESDKSALKQTPLYGIHLNHGARMVPFAGWIMPVQYSGILEEHKAVRTAAGLFDVSHMGEIWIEGTGALEVVQRLITNDAAGLSENQAMYSPMCYPDGGVVDDLLVYKTAPDRYLLVVNAGNLDKDLVWITERAGPAARITDRSEETAQIALQGPASLEILRHLTIAPLEQLKYYWFLEGKVNGVDCLISRTGYTGEDGFEIYAAPEKAAELWESLLEAGRNAGLKPAGLGARDTLRFEAGLLLYGNELSPEITPLEAGLKSFVKLEKHHFIGREALLKQQEQGPAKKLVGFEMLERGIPRSGYPLKDQSGEKIGWVSSGTFAPTLEKNLGLGFVSSGHAAPGTLIFVEIRGKLVQAQVIPRPFYRKHPCR